MRVGAPSVCLVGEFANLGGSFLQHVGVSPPQALLPLARTLEGPGLRPGIRRTGRAPPDPLQPDCQQHAQFEKAEGHAWSQSALAWYAVVQGGVIGLSVVPLPPAPISGLAPLGHNC